MKALLIEKTRQERIIDEVQKKRNLFGLGLTSLIAACSADNAGNGATDETPDRIIPNTTAENLGTLPTANLEATPLVAVTLDNPDTNLTVNLATAGSRNPSSDLFVTVKAAAHDDITRDFIAQFKNGDHNNAGSASIYKGFVAESQYDLVVSSKEFGNRAGTTETGAIYILWDIAGGRTILDVDASLDEKFLKVAGVKDDNVTDVLPDDAPLFYQIGGAKAANTETDQPDMVFRSGATADAATNINILWDVTQYADRQEKDFTVKSNEILQVQGAGTADPEFTKINNNEGYDMIVQGTAGTAGTTYILWDVANYHNAGATAQAVVNLAGADAPEHGLLTIEGLTEVIKTATITANEVGYTDIDGGGVNDLAFVYASNTYILFGEKVANRDMEDKAISYSINLATVATGDFYDKAGTKVDGAAGSTTKAGFFDFDLDGQGGNGVVVNVGYRFAANAAKVDTLANIKTAYDIANPPTADTGQSTLSQEAYWDVA